MPQLSTADGVAACARDCSRPCAFEAHADVPDVPGDDIFGFTTPTDVGNPGDTGIRK